MPEINVLYVDDEQQNLNSFKAGFRTRYRIFTAISVAAALEILDREEIHVLISDQRMPEITGVEFFKMTKERYPHIPRVLLTGYTDVEVLAEAVNKGDIYRYITKPWDELELHNSVLNAYDHYKANRDLSEKIIELQKANDGLNRFVYSLSHELRAPIASAMGILDLVKMEGRTEESGGYWKLMDACVQKLDYYISQTVQFYKTARFKAAQEQIHFEALVRSLIDLYRTSNGTKNINFKVEVDEAGEFYGDKFRIEIVIANLLSNAIKCQRPEEPDKKVEIRITAGSEDARIIVADNGVGMEAAEQARIFDPFFKGAQPGGLGLGLYILQEALEKLNGTVTVHSIRGEGSRFEVHVPNNPENNG
ncbi:hybrid sensor histidine kinase/response regulator [Niabella drilacis]|uniref:histidine kinase n=1 Tax=Niabella drilacis (strain DSM 25811 / CCM 8410 / CCUG 62505 / LMG 26954 / E90) TaxID=1285928 RepID=A0A1G6L451_NIADE|nr:hybrid sensor histidine kinase/response regulator [Niabella drilacis]SDC37888.1 His Kinase A (phospho-acceptor) domain-containing protein [Niabella drilacis]